MKKTKQRVIAIDYFRGLCIMMLLISHSAIFSTPFAYITGMGRLWTSTAEFFFLISGITFGIVRGQNITTSFFSVIKKSLKRAVFLYFLNIILVLIALIMSYYFISSGLTNYIVGALTYTSGLKLLLKILNLSYAYGWASFFMFYSIFLVFAPFALRMLKSRFWPIVPLVSVFIFMMNASPSVQLSPYTSFAIWQLYFFTGLTLSRFRLSSIKRFYSLPKYAVNTLSWLIISTASFLLLISTLLAFDNKLYPFVYKLASEGWMPIKLKSAYASLINQKAGFDFWLGDSRYGVLRPAATLIIFAAAYILYQKYKGPLLRRSGNFVNTMGRDTLWVFAAQAIVIPILAALPLQRSLANNILLTCTLILSMWTITQRQRIANSSKIYFTNLKESYFEAKYAYWDGSEND